MSEKSNTYVIDTSVLIYDPDSIYKVGRSTVIIPEAVLREIDGLKNSDKDMVAQAARKIGRLLDNLSSRGSLRSGVLLGNSGTLCVINDYLKIDVLASEADNKVVGTALKLAEKRKKVTLLTNDANMRSSARIYGLVADSYPVDIGDESIRYGDILSSPDDFNYDVARSRSLSDNSLIAVDIFMIVLVFCAFLVSNIVFFIAIIIVSIYFSLRRISNNRGGKKTDYYATRKRNITLDYNEDTISPYGRSLRKSRWFRDYFISNN
jgi:rRNA maturation endonuclease Nob1